MFFVFYRCAAVWPDNMMYEIYLSVALWRFTSTKFSSHFSQLFSLELFDSLDALRRPNSGSWLNSLYLSSLHELLNSYNLPKLMFNKHDRQKKLPRRITPLHVPNISYTLVPATCKCHCECEISTHITVYIYNYIIISMEKKHKTVLICAKLEGFPLYCTQHLTAIFPASMTLQASYIPNGFSAFLRDSSTVFSHVYITVAPVLWLVDLVVSLTLSKTGPF